MLITCIPGGILDANTYIIQNKNSALCVLIDPTDADLAEEYFRSHSCKPVAILLTHGHFDHTCGVSDLYARYPVPVYLHEKDSVMLTDPLCNGLHVFWPGAPYEAISAYHPLQNVDRLRLADIDIQVIATPGHSEGSVCYLIEGNLFSGDTLFHGGVGRTDLWGGDYKAMFSSLQSLRKLSGSTPVYPGHGDSTTLSAELRN